MKSKINPDSDVAGILDDDQFLNPRKRLKRWLIISALLVAVIVIAWVIWAKRENSNSVQYKTEQVRSGNLTVVVTATGTLQSTNKVDVGSELSGIIKSVEVNYNDQVKAGQILARLDTSKLDAQVTQSKAALESAQAKVLQAQATVLETRNKLAQFQKVRELSQGKVPSQTEFDAAEAAFARAKADEASAKAAVSQAQATLKANETDLAKSYIRSPINGIVLTRGVEPGQTVAAAFTAPVLFTLAEDLTQMELHVNVDEADVGKVQEGQKATFSIAAYPNRTFDARITQARYGSSTTSGVVTYETVLKVNNKDLSLRPGMTATADITVKKIENAVLIPSAALRFTPPVPVKEEKKAPTSLLGSLFPRPPRPSDQQNKDRANNKKNQVVWTFINEKLSSVPVTIGDTDGNMVEMASGDLKPGMPLVVDIISPGK
jgi:HlyD family secretion protein